MPISPDFTWQETDAGLQVKVDLKGVSRKRLDVFATEALIKVNAPPYLFSVDLAHDVEDSKSTATVDKGGVTFILVKKAAGLWGALKAEGDKQEIAKRRAASIDAAHARANAARKAAVDKKKKDEKTMTDRQIDLDNQKRQVIEQRKQAEMDAETDGLKKWQASLHDPAANDSDTESEGEEEAQPAEAGNMPMPDHPEYHGRGWRQEERGTVEARPPAVAELGHTFAGGGGSKSGDIFQDNDLASESDDSDSDSDSSDGEEQVAGRGQRHQVIKPMPPPRLRMEPVKVEFTKLETDVLPAREGREIELKEYKKQQKEAAGLLDSMDVAERQPVFLKDKGDALYKQGNYRGAINAYSRAIQLDPHHLQCISNRAACWLKMGEASQCRADCEDALELLRPRAKRWEEGNATEEDLKQFSKTFTRLLSRIIVSPINHIVCLSEFGNHTE